jgi:hypothetical protein
MVGSDVFERHYTGHAVWHNTGSTAEHRTWAVEGLHYMMNRGKFDNEVSAL